MKILIFFTVMLVLLGSGYLVFQKANTSLAQLKQAGPAKLTIEQAVTAVKKLSEVQDYLKRVPDGKVEVDNELDGEYNVHVYEIKNNHTATFNWYRVNTKNGQITPQFEIKGKVSGRLCYPSEVLPKGKIEAKRLADGVIITQDYPGSLNGGKSDYEFELEEGAYYLRYKISGNLIGYSTVACPTGNEETCGNKDIRQLIKADVKTNQTVTYDLCDFYYSPANAPSF